MFLWLFVTAVMLWIVVFKLKRRRMYKLASRIPGSKDELPFVGSALSLMGDTEDIMVTLQRYCYESMEHNGIVKLWLNHILYFAITNPVDLEKVLKTCLEKDDLHRFMRKVLGNGSIFAPVSIWRRRRKITVPAFSPKNIENFVDVFAKQSEKLVKHLEPEVEKGAFCVWPYISSYTLDSVGETTMGVNINSQGNPDTPFLKALYRLLNLICERIFHLWLQPEWMYKLFPGYYEHQKCMKVLHDFTDKVIKNNWKELENQKREQEYDKSYDFKMYQQNNFLDLLISLSGGHRGYNDVELREEILMITVAGVDTTAVSIGYTLKLLGKYPKIQEKVYKELQEVFDNSDRLLVKEDLPKLKYLERVIKESLRLFPPVPFIIRKVLEDTTLPSGYTLPAGSGVVVCIWGVHRDPQYWGPDADAFDPDRFLPEKFKLQHPCSYMPFSNGPRNCLGYQYAIMSLKTAISTILRRYRVVGEEEQTNIPQIKVKLDIMMKAVDDYQIALERR